MLPLQVASLHGTPAAAAAGVSPPAGFAHAAVGSICM
jgi:hypothetical protein